MNFILIAPFHTAPDTGGLVSGFLHPLLGGDHLLAMVSVGLLSAMIGGRAIWTVPSTFVSVMLLGGIAGLVGIPLPFVEIGIALSVVLLGSALFAQGRIPEAAAMVFVGFFALFHGHAHGAEAPTGSSQPLFFVAYAIGFLVATAGLHVIGAMLGYMALRSERGTLILRGAGAIIAVLGLAILFGVI